MEYIQLLLPTESTWDIPCPRAVPRATCGTGCPHSQPVRPRSEATAPFLPNLGAGGRSSQAIQICAGGPQPHACQTGRPDSIADIRLPLVRW